ncbi:MAG TPA: TonB-dependent receptor, partial [Burkholderiales bacterium]|nr:TonB-dependent receptor [Burkholderiales bacterium]
MKFGIHVGEILTRCAPLQRALHVVAFAGSICLPAAAAEPNLADMSLEELGNLVVTSVSRHEEKLLDAPASIFVITAEDIRRSGVRNLPEALRLAPNLQVARTSAGSYAISSRGFNNAIGNKLLVLIDGRTVYTPLFSGVFWDQQEVMLEDVERIEVISGPGATLWGANAVNGVINVITRAASDTQGGLVAAGVGNRDYSAAVRYGGKLGDEAHYRVYARNVGLDNTERSNNTPVPDAWNKEQAGFRLDWSRDTRGFTIQGDAYTGKSEPRLGAGRVEVSGMNLLTRWNQQFSSGSDIRVQAYYDHSEREDRVGFQGSVNVFDIEFQHGIPIGAHKVLWGGGYRHARDDIPATLPPVSFVFTPQSRTLTWQNVFAHDEIRLTDTVALTLGLKLESNDYTGWEKLPNARLAWKPTERQLVWGAVSRAVRAPARLDRDFSLVFTPLNLAIIKGGPYFESEVAKVYEIGYRAQPVSAVSYSLTAFRHDYDNLRSGMPAPAFIENQIAGFENGVEGWFAFQATRAWRLTGGFSTLRQHLGVKPGSKDPTGPIALGNDPDYQWMMRSSFNVTANHELDVMVRRVGALPLETAGVTLPAYTAVDARWGWHATRSVELSLTLQ